MADATIYEAVGGQAYFDDLAARFYARVRDDVVLRPLYPADDAGFVAAERWLALFLGQYWGGPTTYNEQRGHPRLRMRHAHFLVGHRERDAWYAAMKGEQLCHRGPCAGCWRVRSLAESARQRTDQQRTHTPRGRLARRPAPSSAPC